MKSKIKALSLAVLAIAAMSMVAASAAHAATSELHVTGTGGSAADLTGEQLTQHVFTLTSIKTSEKASPLQTRCTEAKFEATIPANPGSSQTTASEVTSTGRYTGCQSQGPFLATATVKMNGCKYTITDSATSLTSQVDIATCTSGKVIEVSAEGCTVTVPEQTTATGHMVFANKGSGETQDVEANITVQGIQYTIEGTFCIFPKQQHADGDYEGTATFQAFQDTGQVIQKTHNGHQYNEIVCGTQKGLFAT